MHVQPRTIYRALLIPLQPHASHLVHTPSHLPPALDGDRVPVLALLGLLESLLDRGGQITDVLDD